MHSSFIGEHLAAALRLDSLRSSHAIELPCPDEETIAQIFDAISYSKGASVLRMLSSMVGQEVFLKGVSIYLKKHLFGNAETADLWAGISESSGQDVAAVMANWTGKVRFLRHDRRLTGGRLDSPSSPSRRPRTASPCARTAS